MIGNDSGVVVDLWCPRQRHQRDCAQKRNRLLVPGGNHRVAGPHFSFAAGVGLRHVGRAAHLGHVFAALALLDRHGALRHHARQQRSGCPVEGEERKRHGSRTTHGVSVWSTRPESK